MSVRHIRDERELTRALDGRLQLPLVHGARAGDAPRQNLPALRHEGTKQLDIFVVDVVDLVCAEFADLAPPEQRASLALFLVARFLVFVAAAPAAAAAQFTTFIAPPNPVKDSIKAAVVAEQRAMTDSIAHAQITDMKTWVDSAAGIVVVPAIDTTFGARAITTTSVTTSATGGVVAPATASPLPFLLVVGGSAMLLGLALLRRPQLKPRGTNR